MSSVFIGMPVYNGEKFIEKAIESILNQTFSDWELLISDNASQDNTSHICMKYCCVDKRIQYVRQNDNIGAVNNFKFVLEKATGEYFMWAAADDEWDKEFIAACVISLEKNPKIGMAFSNIVNIDSFGRIIRSYPNFFDLSGDNSWKTVSRYVFSPEILGKANLTYSLFRLNLCIVAWNVCPLSAEWGSDMCFVLGALARGGLSIDDRVLFNKRVIRDTDTINRIDKIEILNPKNHMFPFADSFNYLKNNLHAVKGTKYYWLTMLAILIRVPRSFIIFISNIAKFWIRRIMGIVVTDKKKLRLDHE